MDFATRILIVDDDEGIRTLIGEFLERHGFSIATAADPADMRRYFQFATNLNLKAINHIDGRPAIRQITSRQLTDMVVHECWSGPATVELRPNAQAPVFRLPVVEPLEAFYWRADFTLVSGQIVHDYLAE